MVINAAKFNTESMRTFWKLQSRKTKIVEESSCSECKWDALAQERQGGTRPCLWPFRQINTFGVLFQTSAHLYTEVKIVIWEGQSIGTCVRHSVWGGVWEDTRCTCLTVEDVPCLFTVTPDASDNVSRRICRVNSVSLYPGGWKAVMAYYREGFYCGKVKGNQLLNS